MQVLVVTVVHHPDDARILHRQVRALLDAGHEVVYAAPFTAYGATPWEGVEPVDLPRAVGRRRMRALRAARRVVRRRAPRADLVLLHDPELLVAVAGAHADTPVVWDVHEDTAAAVTLKPWLPGPARPVVRRLVRLLERTAERRVRLLLAEPGYVDRFARPHPVVANSVPVPPGEPPAPGATTVVYVGALTRARGAAEMVELGRLVGPRGVRVLLVGGADAATTPLLEAAARDGHVEWLGFQPNDVARTHLPGALAGLSLLHDEPNYAHSQPTKVIEYMAHGIPAITTPNDSSARLVRDHACGVVVPFGDPAAAAAAVLSLREDAGRRQELGRNGLAAARARYDWSVDGPAFVRRLEEWAGQDGPAR